MKERAITFGKVAPSLPDFSDRMTVSELWQEIGEFLRAFDDLNNNHTMCDYYNTLCEETLMLKAVKPGLQA